MMKWCLVSYFAAVAAATATPVIQVLHSSPLPASTRLLDNSNNPIPYLQGHHLPYFTQLNAPVGNTEASSLAFNPSIPNYGGSIYYLDPFQQAQAGQYSFQPVVQADVQTLQPTPQGYPVHDPYLQIQDSQPNPQAYSVPRSFPQRQEPLPSSPAYPVPEALPQWQDLQPGSQAYQGADAFPQRQDPQPSFQAYPGPEPYPLPGPEAYPEPYGNRRSFEEPAAASPPEGVFYIPPHFKIYDAVPLE